MTVTSETSFPETLTVLSLLQKSSAPFQNPNNAICPAKAVFPPFLCPAADDILLNPTSPEQICHCCLQHRRSHKAPDMIRIRSTAHASITNGACANQCLHVVKGVFFWFTASLWKAESIKDKGGRESIENVRAGRNKSARKLMRNHNLELAKQQYTCKEMAYLLNL